MCAKTKIDFRLRRRVDNYGEKKCLSFGSHEISLLEYSVERAERNGRSWSGDIKSLIREAQQKDKELAAMRETIFGVSL